MCDTPRFVYIYNARLPTHAEPKHACTRRGMRSVLDYRYTLPSLRMKRPLPWARRCAPGRGWMFCGWPDPARSRGRRKRFPIKRCCWYWRPRVGGLRTTTAVPSRSRGSAASPRGPVWLLTPAPSMGPARASLLPLVQVPLRSDPALSSPPPFSIGELEPRLQEVTEKAGAEWRRATGKKHNRGPGRSG